MTPPPAVVHPAADAGRAAILAAASGTAQTDLGKPLHLKIQALARDGDWAFLRAIMEDLHGRPVDLADSKLAADAAHGTVSNRYVGLLRRHGHSWTVIVHATGPTDAVWETWASEYGAPASLFSR